MFDRADGRTTEKVPLAPAPAMPGQQALALGPAAPAPTADILFALSATRAVLTANALELTDVAPEVLFYTPKGNTGVFTMGAAQAGPVHIAMSRRHANLNCCSVSPQQAGNAGQSRHPCSQQ